MKKKYRPVLDIPVTTVESRIDIISLLASFAIVAAALCSIFILPDTIPIHWNIRGEADAFGSKYWVMLLPVLSMLFILGNRMICAIPHTHNYMAELTPDNVEAAYIKSRKVIRVTNLIAHLTFLFIQLGMIRGAVNGEHDLGPAITVLIILLIVLPVIYLLIEMRNRQAIN